MKILMVVTLLALTSSAFAGQLEVKVSGMVCSMCAQGIQKKFSKLPEVKELNVDMDKKIVLITTHEGRDVSNQAVTKLITEAGYNVEGIQRK